MAGRFVDFLVLGVVGAVLSSEALAQTYDHLACRKIKDRHNFAAVVDLASRRHPVLPDQTGCKVRVRGQELCVPVAKDVASSTAPAVPLAGQELDGELLCYKVKCPSTAVAELLVTDQFGARALARVRPTKKLCAPARAELVTPPTTLPPAPAKRVFVSSQCYDGGLGGDVGADATCQALAHAASLTGTYRAWLAEEENGPSIRFERSTAPYALVDGTQIAADWNDLTDGTLSSPIELDESGEPTTTGQGCGGKVWTNASTTGEPVAAVGEGLEFVCENWSSNESFRQGLAGDASTTGPGWTDGGPLGFMQCGLPARLYCFEQ